MKSKTLEINITSERVSIRGQLSEFEASALLQDALAHQANLKALQRDRTVAALFTKYQALIFYPVLLAFTIGLSLSFFSFSAINSVSHTSEHHESY